MQKSGGNFCFVPDPETIFRLAKIVDNKSTEQNMVLVDASSGVPINGKFTAADCITVYSMEELEHPPTDLIKLQNVHQATILHTLRSRFGRDQIYTSIGPILVALNPFKWIGIYDDAVKANYKDKVFNLSDNPHVFAMANDGYSDLQYGQSQSIIISGESGAGKTETCKQALNHLAFLAGSSSGIQEKILRASPILEAWGNAKTLRNNNSSRFGKYIEIWFDNHGMIIGSSSTTYLLEKSRVVNQLNQERNYHVFYQVLAGADIPTLQRYQLLPEGAAAGFKKGTELMTSFKYLNSSGCVAIDDIDDVAEHAQVLAAFAAVGFASNDIDNLYRVLAGILLLGNITFQQAGEDEGAAMLSSIDGNDSAAILQRCSAVMGVDYQMLHTALLSRQVRSGGKRGSTYYANYNASTAAETKDALSKEIYRRAFDFIVQAINQLMYEDNVRAVNMIGVLDIFGFEIFKQNSFEQLCINLANEALQQHFNYNIFQAELAIYNAEDVPVPKLDFRDNQDVLDLIMKRPKGLIPMLDEECIVPKGSTEAFVSKFCKQHWNITSRFRFRNKTNELGVVHYAGEVYYNPSLFMQKNKDTLAIDLVEVLALSTNPFIAGLFDEDRIHQRDSGVGSYRKAMSADEVDMPLIHSSPASGRSKGIEAKHTVGKKFSLQLEALMKNLNETKPRYIRCVKPNQVKRPNVFVHSLTNEQLVYSGVFEAVIIMQKGYPFRLSHSDFRSIYHVLIPHSPSKQLLFDSFLFEQYLPRRAELVSDINLLREFIVTHASPRDQRKEASSTCSREQCQFMLELLYQSAGSSVDTSKLFVGNTKVFYKAVEHRQLTDIRELIAGQAVIKLQHIARAYIARHLILPIRQLNRELVQGIRSRNAAQLETTSSSLTALYDRLVKCNGVTVDYRLATMCLEYAKALYAEAKCTADLGKSWLRDDLDDEMKLAVVLPLLKQAKSVQFSASVGKVKVEVNWMENDVLVQFSKQIDLLQTKVSVMRHFKEGLAANDELQLEKAIHNLQDLRAAGAVDSTFMNEAEGKATVIITKAANESKEIVETVAGLLKQGCTLLVRNSSSQAIERVEVDPAPLEAFVVSYTADNDLKKKPKRVIVCLQACRSVIALRKLAVNMNWAELWQITDPFLLGEDIPLREDEIRLRGSNLPKSVLMLIEEETKALLLAAIAYHIVPSILDTLAHDMIPEHPTLDEPPSISTEALEQQLTPLLRHEKYFDQVVNSFVVRIREHIALRNAISSGNQKIIVDTVKATKSIPSTHPDLINANKYLQFYETVRQLARGMTLERWAGGRGKLHSSDIRVKLLEAALSKVDSFTAVGMTWKAMVTVAKYAFDLRQLIASERFVEAEQMLDKLPLSETWITSTKALLNYPSSSMPEVSTGCSSVMEELQNIKEEVIHAKCIAFVSGAVQRGLVPEDIEVDVPANLDQSISTVIEENMSGIIRNSESEEFLIQAHSLHELKLLLMSSQWPLLGNKLHETEVVLTANGNDVFAKQYTAIKSRHMDYILRTQITEKLAIDEVPERGSNSCALLDIFHSLTADVRLSKATSKLLLNAKAFFLLRCSERDGRWENQGAFFFGSIPTNDLPSALTDTMAMLSLSKENKAIEKVIQSIRNLDVVFKLSDVESKISTLRVNDLNVAEVLFWIKAQRDIPASCEEELNSIVRISADRRCRAILLIASTTGQCQGTIDKINHRGIKTDELKSAISFGLENFLILSDVSRSWLNACQLLEKVRDIIARTYALKSADPAWSDNLHELISATELEQVISLVMPGFPTQELKLVFDRVSDLAAFEELSKALTFGGPRFEQGKFDVSRVQHLHLYERLELAKRLKSRSDRCDRLFFYIELVINLRISISANQWDLSDKGEQRKTNLDRNVVTVKRCLSEYVQAQKFFRTSVPGVPTQEIKDEFSMVEREWDRRLTLQRFTHAFKTGTIAGISLNLMFNDVRTDLLEQEIQRVQKMEADSGEVDIDVQVFVKAAMELIQVRTAALEVQKSFRSHTQFTRPTNALKPILTEQAFLTDAVSKAVSRIDEIRKVKTESRSMAMDKLDSGLRSLQHCLRLPFELAEVQLLQMDMSERQFIAEVLGYFTSVADTIVDEARMKQSLYNLQQALVQHYQRKERALPTKRTNKWTMGVQETSRFSPSDFLHDSAVFLVHFYRAKLLNIYDPPDRDWKVDINLQNTPRLPMLIQSLKNGKYPMQPVLRAAARSNLHMNMVQALRQAEAEIEDRISLQELEVAMSSESLITTGVVGGVIVSERSILFAENVINRINTVLGASKGNIKQYKVLLECVLVMRIRLRDERYQDVLTTAAKYLRLGNKDLNFMASIIYESSDTLSLSIAKQEFLLLCKEAIDKQWQLSMELALLRGKLAGVRCAVDNSCIDVSSLEALLHIAEIMHDKSAETVSLIVVGDKVSDVRKIFIEMFTKHNVDDGIYLRSKKMEAKETKMLEDALKAAYRTVINLGYCNWNILLNANHYIDVERYDALIDHSLEVLEEIGAQEHALGERWANLLQEVRKEVALIREHTISVKHVFQLDMALDTEYLVFNSEGLTLTSSYEELSELLVGAETMAFSASRIEERWAAAICTQGRSFLTLLHNLLEATGRRSFTIEPGTKTFSVFMPSILSYLQQYNQFLLLQKETGCAKFAFPRDDFAHNIYAVEQSLHEHVSIMEYRSVLSSFSLVWFEDDFGQLQIDVKQLNALKLQIQGVAEGSDDDIADKLVEYVEQSIVSTTSGIDVREYTIQMIRFRQFVKRHDWAHAHEMMSLVTSTSNVYINAKEFASFNAFLRILQAKRRLEYELLLCSLPDIPYWSLMKGAQTTVSTFGKGLERFMRSLVDGSAEILPKFKLFEELTELSYRMQELLRAIQSGLWLTASDVLDNAKHKLVVDVSVKLADHVFAFWHNDGQREQSGNSVFSCLIDLQQVISQMKCTAGYVKAFVNREIQKLQVEMIAVQLENFARQTLAKIQIVGQPGELMFEENLSSLSMLIASLERNFPIVEACDKLRQSWITVKLLHMFFIAQRDGDLTRLIEFDKVLQIVSTAGRDPISFVRKLNIRLKNLTNNISTAADEEFERIFTDPLDIYAIEDSSQAVLGDTMTELSPAAASLFQSIFHIDVMHAMLTTEELQPMMELLSKHAQFEQLYDQFIHTVSQGAAIGHAGDLNHGETDLITLESIVSSISSQFTANRGYISLLLDATKALLLMRKGQVQMKVEMVLKGLKLLHDQVSHDSTYELSPEVSLFGGKRKLFASLCLGEMDLAEADTKQNELIQLLTDGLASKGVVDPLPTSDIEQSIDVEILVHALNAASTLPPESQVARDLHEAAIKVYKFRKAVIAQDWASAIEVCRSCFDSETLTWNVNHNVEEIRLAHKIAAVKQAEAAYHLAYSTGRLVTAPGIPAEVANAEEGEEVQVIEPSIVSAEPCALAITAFAEVAEEWMDETLTSFRTSCELIFDLRLRYSKEDYHNVMEKALRYTQEIHNGTQLISEDFIEELELLKANAAYIVLTNLLRSALARGSLIGEVGRLVCAELSIDNLVSIANEAKRIAYTHDDVHVLEYSLQLIYRLRKAQLSDAWTNTLELNVEQYKQYLAERFRTTAGTIHVSPEEIVAFEQAYLPKNHVAHDESVEDLLEELEEFRLSMRVDPIILPELELSYAEFRYRQIVSRIMRGIYTNGFGGVPGDLIESDVQHSDLEAAIDFAVRFPTVIESQECHGLVRDARLLLEVRKCRLNEDYSALNDAVQRAEEHNMTVLEVRARVRSSRASLASIRPILPRVWEEMKLLKYDALFHIALFEFSNEMRKVDFTDEDKDHLYRIETLESILEFAQEAATGFPSSEFDRLIEAIDMALQLRQFVKQNRQQSPQHIIDSIAKVKTRDRKKDVTCYMSLLIFELSKLSNVLEFPVLLEKIQREIVAGRRYLDKPIGNINYSEINVEAMSKAYESALPSLEIMGTDESLQFMKLANALLEMRRRLHQGDLSAAMGIVNTNEQYLSGPLVEEEVLRLRVEMENYDAAKLITYGLRTGRCLDVVAIAKMRSAHVENLIITRVKQRRGSAFSTPLTSPHAAAAAGGTATRRGSISSANRSSNSQAKSSRVSRRVSIGIATMMNKFQETYLQHLQDGNDDEEGELDQITTTTDDSVYQGAIDAQFIESVRASIYALRRAVAVARRVGTKSDATKYYLAAAETVLRLREDIISNRWEEVSESVRQDLDLPSVALEEANAVREGLFLQRCLEAVAEAVTKGAAVGKAHNVHFDGIEVDHLVEVVDALEVAMFTDPAAVRIIDFARHVIDIRRRFIAWAVDMELHPQEAGTKETLRGRSTTIELQSALNHFQDFQQTKLKEMLTALDVLIPDDTEIISSDFYWINSLVEAVYEVETEVQLVKEAVNYVGILGHLQAAVEVLPVPMKVHFLRKERLQQSDGDNDNEQLPVWYNATVRQDFTYLSLLYEESATKYNLHEYIAQGDRLFVEFLDDAILTASSYILSRENTDDTSEELIADIKAASAILAVRRTIANELSLDTLVECVHEAHDAVFNKKVSSRFGQQEVACYELLLQNTVLWMNQIESEITRTAPLMIVDQPEFASFANDRLAVIVKEAKLFAEDVEGLLSHLPALLKTADLVVSIRQLLLEDNWSAVETLIESKASILVQDCSSLSIKQEISFIRCCYHHHREFISHARKSIDTFPTHLTLQPRDRLMITQLTTEFSLLVESLQSIEVSCYELNVTLSDSFYHQPLVQTVVGIAALLSAVVKDCWERPKDENIDGSARISTHIRCDDQLFLEFFQLDSDDDDSALHPSSMSKSGMTEKQAVYHLQQPSLTVFEVLRDNIWSNIMSASIQRLFSHARDTLLEKQLRDDLVYYLNKGRAAFDEQGNLTLSGLYHRFVEATLKDIDRVQRLAEHRHVSLAWGKDLQDWIYVARILAEIRGVLIHGTGVDDAEAENSDNSSAARLEKILTKHDLIPTRESIMDGRVLRLAAEEIAVFNAYLNGLRTERALITAASFLQSLTGVDSPSALHNAPAIVALRSEIINGKIKTGLSIYHQRMLRAADELLSCVNAAGRGSLDGLNDHLLTLEQLCTPQKIMVSMPEIRRMLHACAAWQWPTFGDQSLLELRLQRLSSSTPLLLPDLHRRRYREQHGGLLTDLVAARSSADSIVSLSSAATVIMKAQQALLSLDPTAHQRYIKQQAEQEREKRHQQVINQIMTSLCEMLYLLPNERAQAILTGQKILLGTRKEALLPFQLVHRLIELFDRHVLDIETGFAVAQPQWTMILLLCLQTLRDELQSIATDRGLIQSLSSTLSEQARLDLDIEIESLARGSLLPVPAAMQNMLRDLPLGLHLHRQDKQEHAAQPNLVAIAKHIASIRATDNSGDEEESKVVIHSRSLIESFLSTQGLSVLGSQWLRQQLLRLFTITEVVNKADYAVGLPLRTGQQYRSLLKLLK